MSKLELKKYLKSLKKRALEEQILDLYTRFKEVRVFYDFAFNPKEQDLLDAAKAKIFKEYFPQTRRRPKARRSVAQNLIKQYMTLGMDPGLLADLMLFNLETAIEFARNRHPAQESFYTSLLKSFIQCLDQLHYHRLLTVFQDRVSAVARSTETLKWRQAPAFQEALELGIERYEQNG